MRALLWLTIGVGLGACNDAGTAAVAIRPTYGWVDGCTDVTITGRGLGDDVSVKLGDHDLDGVTTPDPEASPEDAGYVVYGTTTASAEAGAVDVLVTVGASEETSETYTIPSGFYYVECLGAPYPESVSPVEGVDEGTAISVTGCNLDAEVYQARIHTMEGEQASGALELTSVCGTASVLFTAPDLPDGDYQVVFLDGDGVQVLPEPCVDAEDTGDTGGEPVPCDKPFPITYGGAE